MPGIIGFELIVSAEAPARAPCGFSALVSGLAISLLPFIGALSCDYWKSQRSQSRGHFFKKKLLRRVSDHIVPRRILRIFRIKILVLDRIAIQGLKGVRMQVPKIDSCFLLIDLRSF